MSGPDPEPVTASLPVPEPTPPSAARSAAILLALLMGILLGALDNFIVATALPTITSDLNGTAGFAFVVSSYLIAQTVAIPIFGKLSDRFGRRSFYLMGLGIFLAGSTAAGLSQNLNELIVFRAVQGLGSGAFFTVVFSIVADLFPPKAAARLAGLLSGVFGIAIVFGPLIGSYIVETTTWRWIFFVNLPVGFTAIALVIAFLGPLRPAHRPLPFDAVGAVLMAGWVGTLIYALVETAFGWAWTDTRTIGLLATAVLLFVVFVWQESRTADPLVPLRYFRNRLIAASSGVNFLRGAILVVVVTFIPYLVMYGLGGSTESSRDVLYAFMAPMIVGAALGGYSVTQVGYRPPVVIGLALATLGLFLLTAVPTQPPIFRFSGGLVPVGIVGALIPLGLGVGLTFAPTQLAIQYSVPRDAVGTGNSLVWFIGNLGGSIVLSIFQTFQGDAATRLLGTPLTSPAAFVLPPALRASAWAVSIQDVWWWLIPFAIAGLVSAALMAGRLPKTAHAADGGDAPLPPMMG